MQAGRPLWWAAGLSLCLLVVVGIVAVVHRDSEHRVEVTSSPRPDRDERAVLASAALQRLERQVAAGDPASVVAQNARALRVRDFSVRYVDEDAGALAGGTDDWVAAVDTSWAFAGFDQDPARTEVSFTFRQVGDRASIVSIGGNGRRTPLWLSGPVSVRRDPDALVVAAGGGPEAAGYLALADRAVDVVHRVLPEWTEGLVVEVADSTAGLDAELDAEPGEYAQIAAVTTSADGSVSKQAPVHVYVNPEVFGPLRGRGAQVVLSHEATHVATGAATANMPLWLVEGFADYVALRDVDLPLSVTAAQIAGQVRQHGVPRGLPGDDEFGTSTTHLGASYEAAWLACRSLARLGGEQALVAYYDAVRAGGGAGPEMRRVFGFSQQTFTERWQARLRHLAA